jgi:hypothetical protein
MGWMPVVLLCNSRSTSPQVTSIQVAVTPIQPKEYNMRIKQFLLAAVLALLSASAFAFHCPQEMKKIDEALAANPKLTASQLADVKKLRAEGETLHKAGKHQEALDTLGKAEAILKIN